MNNIQENQLGISQGDKTVVIEQEDTDYHLYFPWGAKAVVTTLPELEWAIYHYFGGECYGQEHLCPLCRALEARRQAREEKDAI